MATFTTDSVDPGPTHQRAAALSEKASFCGLLIVIAWAQFPLGSNREWSTSLLTLMVSFTLALWLPKGVIDIEVTLRNARRVGLPASLMLGVVFWALFQASSWPPTQLHHPIWQIVSNLSRVPIAGSISINPFDTVTDVMRLLTYLTVGWLTYDLCQTYERARQALVAIFLIGLFYSLYGIMLSALATSQGTLLEGLPPAYGRAVTGGFVAKNNFATFCGIALVAGVALAGQASAAIVVWNKGWRRFLQTVLSFAFDRGLIWILGSLVLFVALVASGSRAGLIATLLGLFVEFLFAVALSVRAGRGGWAIVAGGIVTIILLTIFTISGQLLQDRFLDLVETAGAYELRPTLWHVAENAISAHPLLGVGLGTYPDAYYLYADQFIPFIVDRTHNDYLEFAMGVGVPAALLWIAAFVIFGLQCARGALRRRRRQAYAVTAVAATILVGFHSVFDFSLQIPAVAVLYAAILAIGVAQSRNTSSA